MDLNASANTDLPLSGWRDRAMFPLVPLVGAVIMAVVASTPAGAVPRSGEYAIERVSPVDTGGQRPNMHVIRKDGELVALNSAGAFADTENSMLSGGTYLSSRGSEGWLTRAIAPPGRLFSRIQFNFPVDTAADAETNLYLVERDSERNTKRYITLRRDADGTLTEVGPVFDDSSAALATVISGSDAELRTFVVTTSSRVGYTDGRPDTRSAAQQTLMRVTPDSGTSVGYRAVQVAYRNGATMLPNCTPVLGGERSKQGAVSEDGHQVVFSFPAGLGSCISAANQRVWAKVGDADPVDLSATQCTTACGSAAVAYFEGASLDGRRVFFTTAQKLVDSDLDSSSREDLYVYDADATGSELRSITASSDPVGAGVKGVTAVSEDGTTVFFVANGRPLTRDPNNRGEIPEANVDNLYVFHQARGSSVSTIRFVGRPSPNDLPRTTDPAQVSWLRSTATSPARTFHVSSNGAFALIPSRADLTRDRAPGDDHPDLFRYDVQRDRLQRIWSADPAHNGTQRSAGTYPLSVARQIQALRLSTASSLRVSMPDDGSVVAIQTAEALDPADVNGVFDVYLWESSTNRIRRLSGGTAARPAGLSGVSENGDVFFSDDAQLVPGAYATLPAVYVARRGGGFPEPPALPGPCVLGVNCQPEVPPAPGPDGPAGSSTFVGPGNVLTAPSVPVPSIRVSPIKIVRGAATRVMVRVSGKGTLRVSGSGLARTSRLASKAGSYRTSVKLSERMRKTLRRKGRVKVRATIRFVPEGGKSIVRRVSVTFTTRGTSGRSSARSTQGPTPQSPDSQKGR